jgi:hypothetical protein
MPIYMHIKKHYKISSIFRSSTLRLTTPYLYERVDKCTHEPLSIFKPLETTFSCFYSLLHFYILLNPKIPKILLFSAILYKTQKQLSFTTLVYFLVLVYFLLFMFCYLFCVAVLIPKPCAWQPLGGVRDTRQRRCFAGCLTTTIGAFSTVPYEFNIKPRVTLVGKIILV